ncbi:hypothetical protein [Gimesia panareensis]|uniref:Uncharacterized protein n=1 Tax=Gimesia panareensis TaxID=2527978 RepID=A0A517QCA3_9PLAN|nr:hypothetical protein [Gimesia panareensis]QDT29249.1 hypothetical protein Enr10x_45990 [Gimesia panareensis]QDU52099.1 hypothetical protein Pan110_44700 [Gimesia panareensis]
MKGPGLKLDLDVRRLWKCPKTGQTIRLSGNVVSKSTEVNGETVFMQLIEEQRKLHEDPYHFDFTETAESDQSSSERAAAAARSLEAEEPGETPAAEPAEREAIAENAESEAPAEPEHPADDSEESFGDGLV